MKGKFGCCEKQITSLFRKYMIFYFLSFNANTKKKKRISEKRHLCWLLWHSSDGIAMLVFFEKTLDLKILENKGHRKEEILYLKNSSIWAAKPHLSHGEEKKVALGGTPNGLQSPHKLVKISAKCLQGRKRELVVVVVECSFNISNVVQNDPQCLLLLALGGDLKGHERR